MCMPLKMMQGLVGLAAKYPNLPAEAPEYPDFSVMVLSLLASLVHKYKD